MVATWLKRWPSMNLGGVPPQGTVVVDGDARHSEGVNPLADWPATETHISGSGEGSEHRIYVDINGHFTSQASLSNAIDVRLPAKGQIVLPPSLHASGLRYRLADARPPDLFPYHLLPASPPPAKHARAAGVLATWADGGAHTYALELKAAARLANIFINGGGSDAEFEALMRIIDSYGGDPDAANVNKFYGLVRKERMAKSALSDEAPGGLVAGLDGYLTNVGSGTSIEVVQVTDFTLTVKGRLTLPTEQIWIVDLHTSEGLLENQHLSSHITASTSALQRWLHGRGCALFSHSGDKLKGTYGSRLLALMKSQDYLELGVTDHYGWHPSLGQFITAEGVFDAAGVFGPFTTTHPNPRLQQASPVNYGDPTTESVALARKCLSRLLALQDRSTTRIIGAWLMMLLLRDQWQGTFPGLLVEAFAGTGKTTFFKIFSALAGVPQQGNNMTRASARDYSGGNANGFVWFDDVLIDEATSQLIRKIVTRGTETLKTNTPTGWVPSEVTLLSSVIVTDESVDWHRQKAFRDRFISLKFISRDDRASEMYELLEASLSTRGALLPLVLRVGGPLLAERWSTLSREARNRVSEVETMIAMGAEILAAVLDDPSWAVPSDQPPLAEDFDSASECVLRVFPTLWRDLGYPGAPGAVNGRTGVAIWYDASTLEFKIHGAKVADAWENRRSNVRQLKITDRRAIKRELDACGAPAGEQTWVGLGGSDGVNVRYRALPEKYSAIVRRIALDEDEL